MSREASSGCGLARFWAFSPAVDVVSLWEAAVETLEKGAGSEVAVQRDEFLGATFSLPPILHWRAPLDTRRNVCEEV